MFRLLRLLLVIRGISAFDCINNLDKRICVNSEGSYFLLGNGTWNISLTEGDSLSERETFLKYLENDKCGGSVGSPKVDSDYCYCKLGYPLQRHPVTNGLIIPAHLNCERSIKGHVWWHPIRKFIEQCRSNIGPINFPFLCVTLDNLMQMEYVYNNAQLLSEESYRDMIRKRRTQLSWRNTSSVATKDISSGSTHASSNKSTSENATQPESVLIPGLNFNIRTDNETEIDYVIIEKNPINNQTISFSARTECLSKQRKWDVYPLCSYRIDATNISDCYDMTIAVRMSSAVIFQFMANLSQIQIIEEPSWKEYMSSVGNESRSYEDTLTCENFPGHLSAIEVWAEGEHITTILSFETEDFVEINNEINLTGATGQKIVGQKEYTGLSRFWAKFYFGECLYRQCWRDLWSILPPDMIDSSATVENDGYLQLRFFMPLFILCFVLLVRNYIINSEHIMAFE